MLTDGQNLFFLLLKEKPKKSRCLGVFGLSVYTTKDQIIQIFSKYGPIEHVQVVVDASVSNNLLNFFDLILYTSNATALFEIF